MEMTSLWMLYYPLFSSTSVCFQGFLPTTGDFSRCIIIQCWSSTGSLCSSLTVKVLYGGTEQVKPEIREQVIPLESEQDPELCSALPWAGVWHCIIPRGPFWPPLFSYSVKLRLLACMSKFSWYGRTSSSRSTESIQAPLEKSVTHSKCLYIHGKCLWGDRQLCYYLLAITHCCI